MAVSKKSMEALNKAFGKGSVMKMGDKSMDIETISTGSLEIDYALGGGIVRGKVVELFGPESSGKTTLALSTIVQAQKMGLNALFIDAEHALDPSYCEKLGVDVKELAITQPGSGEQALDICSAAIDTGEFQLIVVDSTSSLVPEAELEGEMSDSRMGAQARLLSKGLRVISGKASDAKCTIIFISQLREKIGVVYGSNVTIGVGNALKFYASQRVEVKRVTKPIEENGVAVAHVNKIKVIKNKIAPPFRACETILRYNEGYDVVAEIINMGSEMGIINKSGSWFSYQDTKLGQGVAAVTAILKDNPELYEELHAKVLEGLKQQ